MSRQINTQKHKMCLLYSNEYAFK